MITDKVILKYELEKVTPGEISLVEMLANDYSRMEIAEKMQVSIRTVEFYFFNLRKRFGCRKEAALVTIFFRAKLIR